jgi:hypothetical protein
MCRELWEDVAPARAHRQASQVVERIGHRAVGKRQPGKVLNAKADSRNLVENRLARVVICHNSPFQ